MNMNSLSNMGLSKDEARVRVDMQMRFQKHMLMSNNWQSCLNCLNFSEARGKTIAPKCDLNGQLPPPHIIVHGCEMHEDDIPF